MSNIATVEFVNPGPGELTSSYEKMSQSARNEYDETYTSRDGSMIHGSVSEDGMQFYPAHHVLCTGVEVIYSISTQTIHST
ncbi:MAG: hypothetical protein U9Q15_01130 [Patescibacteria group bacterium]|nr:hypothetical protein [Patescibacteria group bacterium]